MPTEHIEKLTEARLSNPGQYIQGIGANRDPLDAAFFIQGFPDSSVGRESTCSAGDPSLIPGSGRSNGEGIGYSAGRESACSAGDLSSTPELGRSSGEGKVYPLQYSGLENSTDCIAYGSQRIGHD